MYICCGYILCDLETLAFFISSQLCEPHNSLKQRSPIPGPHLTIGPWHAWNWAMGEMGRHAYVKLQLCERRVLALMHESPLNPHKWSFTWDTLHLGLRLWLQKFLLLVRVELCVWAQAPSIHVGSSMWRARTHTSPLCQTGLPSWNGWARLP